jgi:integrase/recombinase XerD
VTFIEDHPLDGYAQWMQSSGWTARTVDQRLRRARKILERWPDPTGVTPGEIVEYLGWSEVLKPTSRATYYNDTKAFFRWMTGLGLISANPMDSDLVVKPRPSPGTPKPLSRDEEARALAFARGDVRAYLLLALRAGLRASEIAAFRGEQIAEDFIILVGKGAKEAGIPTHPDLWHLAQEYPRRGAWFPSPYVPGKTVRGSTVGIAISRLFRRQDVDIPTGSIHRCRHSYATNLLRSGANLRQVQELMRHASLNTTAVYTAVSEDELRTAINRLGDPATRGVHLRSVR